jgi:hypothetical protein
MKRAISSSPQQPPHKSRRFEHVDGNWPCHVCISFGPEEESEEDSEEEEALSSTFEAIEALANSAVPILKSNYPNVHIFPSERPYHISLSHTFVLREHQINSFLKTLKKELSTSTEYQLVLTNAIVEFINQNNTCKFYALHAEGGTNATRLLIEHINKVLIKMGQPTYHENPSIHASIGWSPIPVSTCVVVENNTSIGNSGDHVSSSDIKNVNATSEKIRENNAETSISTDNTISDDTSSATLEVAIRVSKVTCKIGNRIERIHLVKR